MTKSRIATCLWYDRDGEDAAQLYVSLIPNSRIDAVSRYEDALGIPSRLPAGTALVVEFTLDGVAFQALNGGPEFKQSEAASIVVHCDDQAEIDRLWSALTANGGAESMCGWLKDRYGVSWQIVPRMLSEGMLSGNKPAVARMTHEMLQMRKLEIARLQAAFDGHA